MFMIFDDSLSKQLTKNQLTVLCETFEKYIQTREEDSGDFMPLYDPEEVVDQLIKKS